MLCSFFIPGKPATKGSTRPYVNKQTGLVIPANDKHLRLWVNQVRAIANEYWRKEPTRNPIGLTLWFQFLRPKSHFGTGRNENTRKPSAPKFHATRPDVDKLIRAIKDGLTGIVYVDDSQVWRVAAHKVYSDVIGVDVQVYVEEGTKCAGL